MKIETDIAAANDSSSDNTSVAPEGDTYAFNLSRQNTVVSNSTVASEGEKITPAAADSNGVYTAPYPHSAAEAKSDQPYAAVEVSAITTESAAEAKEPESKTVAASSMDVESTSSAAPVQLKGRLNSFKSMDSSSSSAVPTAETTVTDAMEVAYSSSSSSASSSGVGCGADSDRPFNKRVIWCGENMPKFVDDTEDVDDVHFDTRQSFLNLCQGNHYQFDQLRRAKHSSMMVLYHLHNPDAPKFVHNCNLCHMDILTGTRHHCETCDIDFCHGCVSQHGKELHPEHTLRAISLVSSVPTQMTEEQRRERQRSVTLHLQLLQHSANCPECTSKNCKKMKVTFGSFLVQISGFIHSVMFIS